MTTKSLITITTIVAANAMFLGLLPFEISNLLSGCCVGLAYAIGEDNAKK